MIIASYVTLHTVDLEKFRNMNVQVKNDFNNIFLKIAIHRQS